MHCINIMMPHVEVYALNPRFTNMDLYVQETSCTKLFFIDSLNIYCSYSSVLLCFSYYIKVCVVTVSKAITLFCVIINQIVCIISTYIMISQVGYRLTNKNNVTSLLTI